MMCKRFLMACLLAATLCGTAAGQTISPDYYKASAIPDSLKQDAYSVVRYELEETIVKGPGKVLNKLHSIVTVLNEKADYEARRILYYDKNISINAFQMVIYDADGKEIKKYKKSDMYDRSASDESMLTDTRFKAIRHMFTSYPATVELIYETDNNSSLGYGTWAMQTPDRAVQNAYCKFIVYAGNGLRFKNKNTTIAPQKTMVGGNEVYLWHVASQKAVKDEKGVPAWSVTPRIDFSATKFEYDGRPGDISTWTEFGKWINTLNDDVNTLPPARAEEIRKMTANLPDDKAKAKFLYEYMQQNMRYVSIQLGIGGLKPFPAAFVDQKKYGDCKALSNYMYALLKAVNIPSNYVIIRAGENEEPVDATFSQNRFNHAILCIPFKGDTTWLECTSTTQPFGKLGTFTENRNALLISSEGGKLVSTPKSKAADNVFASEVNIKLNADGSAKSIIKISGSGEYRSLYVGMAEMKKDDQKEYFIRAMHIKQPPVFDFKQGDDKDGVKAIDIEMEYDKFYDMAAGNKQFYRPGAFDLWAFTCPAEEKRRSDYYFEHPLQKTCKTVIELPEGFEIDALPVNQKLKFSYGDFDVNYTYDAAKNQVLSTAKFNLTQHVIPAAKYTEMQQYMDAVAKAQNKKLVIRRKA